MVVETASVLEKRMKDSEADRLEKDGKIIKDGWWWSSFCSAHRGYEKDCNICQNGWYAWACVKHDSWNCGECEPFGPEPLHPREQG